MNSIIPYMKNFVTLFVILFTCMAMSAQKVKKEYDQDWKLKLSKEVRESGDPFYQRGDTLYLLFDHTDTLQAVYGEAVYWYLRLLTDVEEKNLRNGNNSVLLIVLKRLSPKNNKRITLSFKDLEGKILTSRKELMDFYEREFERRHARYRETKDSKYPIAPGAWNLRIYFKQVYMIIPLENDKFMMYEVFS